ncbi:hypothetical protein IAE22_35645, partial [Bacillus sp. S34]|nr:hypothetical protein [Bacillus sp. S34]
DDEARDHHEQLPSSDAVGDVPEEHTRDDQRDDARKVRCDIEGELLLRIQVKRGTHVQREVAGQRSVPDQDEELREPRP